MTKTAVRTLTAEQLAAKIAELKDEVGSYVILTVVPQHEDTEPEWCYLARIGQIRANGPALRLLSDGGWERVITPADTDVVQMTLLPPYERRIAHRIMGSRKWMDVAILFPDGGHVMVERDKDSYDRYMQVVSSHPRYCVEFEAERGDGLLVYCTDLDQVVEFLTRRLCWVPDLEPSVQDLHKGTNRMVAFGLTIHNWP